jgi:hypothetical protein
MPMIGRAELQLSLVGVAAAQGCDESQPYQSFDVAQRFRRRSARLQCLTSEAIYKSAKTLYYPVKSELKLLLDGVALFVKFPARLADLEHSVSSLRLGLSLAAGAFVFNFR